MDHLKHTRGCCLSIHPVEPLRQVKSSGTLHLTLECDEALEFDTRVEKSSLYLLPLKLTCFCGIPDHPQNKQQKPIEKWRDPSSRRFYHAVHSTLYIVYHSQKLRISRIPPSSRPGVRCRNRSICLGNSSARPAPLGAKRRQGPLPELRK